MLGNLPEKGQKDLFCPMLDSFINEHRELVGLVNAIDWSYFEKEFSGDYSRAWFSVSSLVPNHRLLVVETDVQDW